MLASTSVYLQSLLRFSFELLMIASGGLTQKRAMHILSVSAILIKVLV